MKSYEAMYHTPIGFKSALIQAESLEEAKRLAEARCRFGVIELMWIRPSDFERVSVR